LANNFALRRQTYEAIPEEHILVFQFDGAFCLQHARSLAGGDLRETMRERRFRMYKETPGVRPGPV
jgi:hypothetical protein